MEFRSIHNDEVGVDCPDCGQHFAGCISDYEADDSIFKKPTILSRVVQRIFRPFYTTDPGSSTITHTQGQQQQDKYSSYRQYKRRYRDIEREESELSVSGRSDFRYSPSVTWKRHRGQSSSSYYRNGSCSSLAPSRPGLNLEKYLQPQRQFYETVQAWVNDLQNLDPVDSLLTEDLSCNCKNGVNAEKDKLVDDFLKETGATFQRIQKSLEDIKLLATDGKNSCSDKNIAQSALIASQQIKAVIADCTQSQTLVSNFLAQRS